MNKYVFRRYSPLYKSFFDLERKRLQAKLAKNVAIEHIGSTAVPGLGGKNILDIAIGPKTGLSGSKAKLEKLGYQFIETAGTENRLFLRRDYSFQRKKVRVHIHLTKFNSGDWNEMIAFRDYLRNNKEATKEYIKIKRRAAQLAEGNKDTYMKIKSPFIQMTIEKALKEIGQETTCFCSTEVGSPDLGESASGIPFQGRRQKPEDSGSRERINCRRSYRAAVESRMKAG
jgi:GrpB-like predicted nucleotidyltransferase (UPF0157 family)